MTDATSRPLSPGQMLRAAREAKGLHLAMLSVALKVPTRQLEALENDQYEVFKGATFVRALAQAMCRHLALDPAPVLAGLPQMTSPFSQSSVRSTDAVMSAPGQWGAGVSRGKGVSRTVLLLSALMLAGSAALIWWPGAASDVAATADVLPVVSQAPLPMESASAPADVSVQQASAPTSQAVPAASAAVPVVSPSVAASQEQPVPENPPLLIRASADAWVSIRDSRGETVFKRQVKAGELVKLDTAPPLFVYAGRADGIQLTWRGQLVDLKPYTQNNEVRLPIKP